MAIRKPGPGSTQSEISAYIRQEVAKRMGVEGPKRSAMKKSPASTAVGKASINAKTKKQLMEKAKKSKPAPKLS